MGTFGLSSPRLGIDVFYHLERTSQQWKGEDKARSLLIGINVTEF
jgi:hypothetical protein